MASITSPPRAQPPSSFKQFFLDIYNNPWENKSKIALVMVVVVFIIFVIVSLAKRSSVPSTTPVLPFKQRVPLFFKNIYYHPGDNIMPLGIMGIVGLGLILGPIYLTRRYLDKKSSISNEASNVFPSRNKPPEAPPSVDLSKKTSSEGTIAAAPSQERLIDLILQAENRKHPMGEGVTASRKAVLNTYSTSRLEEIYKKAQLDIEAS